MHLNESSFSIPRCTRADGFNKDNMSENSSERITFELLDAYPNPFNPTTTISFSIPERSKVILTVFDIMDQFINVIEDKILDEGIHSYSFNAYDIEKQITSGVYIYKLSSTSLVSGKTYIKSKKLVLIK